jgi:Cu/Ag efflux protein CusF
MKKVLALIIALMFAFAVTAAFAAEAPKAGTPAEKKKDTKKKATVTGEVIAIDAKANTLTVKGPKKGDVALIVNDKTKITAGKDKKTLADIKSGDKVAVEYTEADKNTANKIDIKAASAKKDAPKAEEKKPAAPAPAAAPKAEEKKPAAPAKKSAGY